MKMQKEESAIMPENKNSEITKTCSACRQPKFLVEFYNMKKETFGKDNYCKICRSKKSKRWERKNKKRRVGKKAEWWQRVKEIENPKRRKYWKKIKDVVNAKRRKAK